MREARRTQRIQVWKLHEFGRSLCCPHSSPYYGFGIEAGVPSRSSIPHTSRFAVGSPRHSGSVAGILRREGQRKVPDCSARIKVDWNAVLQSCDQK